MSKSYVEPPAPYLGGKRLLAARLCRLIAAITHQAYIEPFVGMGGVFFRRRWPAPVEIVNDISRDVTNLFQILQRHYPQFMDVLKFQLTSRDDFERLVATPPESLTDLERAARSLYLQRLSFGGKVRGRMFGVSRDNPARFNLTTLGQDLAAIHERLASVIIECLPYDDLIARYDGPNVLFYLDPPYWGCEADYGKGVFTRADFRVLARRLSAIEGICLLSINDVPEIRAIFDGFEMLTVETHYSIGGGKGTPAAELIISNRPIPPGLIQMPDDQRDLF